jgi:LuxR family maltose regulon positive regulatory protein
VRGVTIETAVDELMNGLVTFGRPVAIVLDDLHTVKSEVSVRSVGHAIKRMPHNARLLVSTRSGSPIGLARMRARRTLTEIRARELAFTVDEAHELIVHEGIGLSGQGVELLVERTEGWPAGLYLAALWLRGLENPDEGVRAFVGSARHVADYLADEALTALPPQTRDFLLRTSVLGRFTPELCDAVLDRRDSSAMLAELARSNMFLVALDARGEWYRYHHLFGEVLQLELGREAAPELRRRAAAWCRAHGFVEDAIEYAAAAGDADLVAELLLEHHLQFIWGGRLAQFLGWIRWLPAEQLAEHPLLPASAAAAAALVSRPEVEVQQLLAVAEGARARRPQLWSPYVEAAVEVTRAEMIQGGDVGAAVEHGRRAVAAAREGADVLVPGVLASLSQALFFAGALDEARHVAVEVVERPDGPGVPDGYVGALGLLALIDAEQGRTDSAGRGLARPSASRARTFRRTPGSRRWRTSGWRWRAPPPGAWTRPNDRRYVASACDARRSRPLGARTRCSCSLRYGSREGASDAQPATSSAHNGQSRSFQIPGGYRRLRPRSSRGLPRRDRTRSSCSHRSSRARPSWRCSRASQPAYPDAKSAPISTFR